MNGHRGACLAALLVVASPVLARAQATGASRPLHRVEVTGGGGLASRSDLGGMSGTLRANSPTPQPYPLFSADTRMARAPLAEARVGIALSRRFGVEGRLGYSRPELRSSVRADAEGAAAVTVVERIDQYVIDAGIVVMLDEVRVGRLVPFAAAGAGYLRQLHEGLTVVEQGHVYHLGGGVKQWLVTRDHGIIRAAGLRADARMELRSGGIAVADRRRSQFAISGGLFVTF